MASTPHEVRLAVESFCAREVPDGRTRICDVSVDSEGDDIIVTGTVSTHGLAQRLFARLRTFPSIDRTASSVRVLEDMGSECTVTEAAVPVRNDPDGDAEQLTQLLYGDRVVGYDASGGWRRVRACDGYVGWVDKTAVRSAEKLQTDAVLQENVGSDDTGFLPIGSPCTVLEDCGTTVNVRFRTGVTTSVPTESLTRPAGLPSGDDIVETARLFTGTEYEWGGMTTEGIDCSGLVWVSYRVFGVELPRDTDQQEAVGTDISREELRPR